MKKTIIWILMILTIQSVYALSCPDEIEITSNCTMITPVLNCTGNFTYDIINTSDNTLITTRGTLSQVYEGIYEFNFTYGEGEYIIKLCDESTRQVRVTVSREVKARMYIAIIIGILGVISIFTFLTYHFHKKATIKETEGEISGIKDLIKDANWFKAMELFCILFILFLTILLNNTARLIAKDSGASSSILTMFNSLHIALIAAIILFLTFIMLRFLVLLVENFKREKIKKELGEKGEQ